MDRGLRRLDASMLVVDETVSLEMNGGGDVLEPVDGLMAIGSGGTFALAAARALVDTDLTALEIAEKSMKIAADMCVYTNHSFIHEVLETKDDANSDEASEADKADKTTEETEDKEQ